MIVVLLIIATLAWAICACECSSYQERKDKIKTDHIRLLEFVDKEYSNIDDIDWFEKTYWTVTSDDGKTRYFKINHVSKQECYWCSVFGYYENGESESFSVDETLRRFKPSTKKKYKKAKKLAFPFSYCESNKSTHYSHMSPESQMNW